jgi:nitronate monooxygenase
MRTSFTELLGIQHPIALAAMDLVADAKLTLAVSDAGGFGILGGGYGDADWLARELPILAEAKEKRGVRFGAGFITWSLAKQPQLLDQALAAGPDAVWLSFGDPGPFISKIKGAGALVICQVQTVVMARDAVEKGADIIVAQGSEAGGHGMSCGSFTLLPAVADAIGHKVPVALAGGVADGRGLAAALMLGAQGAVLGTRFYASDEAAGHPDAKRRIASASVDETRRSIVFDVARRNIWPVPYTGRCLVNQYSERWAGQELELLRRADLEQPKYLEARRAGDFAIAPVIAGEAAGLIHEILPVRDIVDRIVKEAESLLKGQRSTREAQASSPEKI